jgi:hypothetical protein
MAKNKEVNEVEPAVPQRNVLAAIRELAAAVPQHGHTDIKTRIEEILSQE